MKALALLVCTSLSLAFAPALAAKKAPLTPAKAQGKYHAFADVDSKFTYIVRLNPGAKATVTKTQTVPDTNYLAPPELKTGTWMVKDNVVIVKHEVYEDHFEYVDKAKNDALEGYHQGLRHVKSFKSGSPLEALELFKYPLKYRKGL